MKDLAYNLGGFLHLLTWKDYMIMLLVFLVMVLLLVIYYLVKLNDEKIKDIFFEEEPSNKDVDLNLKEITKQIEEEEPRSIKLTDYELEQEDKAIISYQELINRNKNVDFFVDDEEDYQNFEVKIKKINLDDLNKQSVKKKSPAPTAPKVQMMSYDHETDFLAALKKLQNKLSK